MVWVGYIFVRGNFLVKPDTGFLPFFDNRCCRKTRLFGKRRAKRRGASGSTHGRFGKKKRLVVPYQKPAIAINKNDQWYLPAGTLVKHGTSSNNLKSIVENGLLPSEGRAKSRDIIEALPVGPEGIYVASCYAAYGSSMYNFCSSFQDAMESTDANIFTMMMGRKKYAQAKFSVPPNVLKHCGLPVVLNIQLQEDCAIRADEDYVDGISPSKEELQRLAGKTWDEYGSTALSLEHIPSHWIKSIETPELSYRSEVEERMLYLATHDVDVITAASTIAASTLRDPKRPTAEARFLRDTELLTSGVACCQFKDPMHKKAWSDSLAADGGLSGSVTVKEVPAFLSTLERDSKKPLLATGYSLWKLFSLQAAEIGLSVSGR